MDAYTLMLIAIVAHLCKPPFRRRASVLAGNPLVGIGSALMFLALSLASFGATVMAVILMGVKLWN
jgi:hypothetical protein